MMKRISVLLAGLSITFLTVMGLSVAASAVSQASAQQQLSNAGITHSSSGGCTDRNNGTCTSYEGIRQSTIDGIITYRQASGCAVNITGGTETGHYTTTYSHWNGYKVDISRSTCNDNRITGTYPRIGDSGACGCWPTYRSAAGNVYVNEGNHWDITYY